MPKYSEKNVLQIKRDIQKVSEELRLINEEKEKVLRELEIFRLKSSEEKKINSEKIANAWIQAGDDLKKVQEDRKNVEKEILRLSGEKTLLEYQVSSIKTSISELINKLTLEEKNRAFIEKTIDETKKVLDFLCGKKVREETLIEQLSRQHVEFEKSISDLKIFEDKYKTNISDSEKVIEENRTRISKLLKERDALQGTLDDIEKREQAVWAMEQRLTPEYRKMYLTIKKTP